MADIASLRVRIAADIQDFEAGMNKTESRLGGLASYAKTAGLGIATGLLAGAAASLKAAGEAEKAAVSFRVMLGSVDAATKTLTELKDFAANTPFEFPEVQAAAKKLLAFNTPAKELKETLRQLGDIASGVDAPIGEIAEIFGKARVQGRLFAEDINQLTGRGIPVIQEFAKQFGVTDGEVRKLVETGKIGFPQLQKAFADLTKEGSKFGGLMAQQSQTIPGLVSNLSDAVGQAAAKIGARLADALNLKELLAGVAGAVGSLTATSEDSARGFLKQRDGVNALAAAVNPLLGRYDELKNKTNLSKLEQGELRSIIERVAKQIPSAISAFDSYGKAIDINTEAGRRFLQGQQEILAVKNKEALTQQRQEYKRLTEEINLTTQALNKRNAAGQIVRTDVGLGQAGAFDVELTGAEIAKLQARLEALRAGRRGVGGLIQELKGIAPAAIEANKELPLKPPVAPQSAADVKKLERAIKDLAVEYTGLRTVKGLVQETPEFKLKVPEIAKLPTTLPTLNVTPFTGPLQEATEAMYRMQLAGEQISEKLGPLIEQGLTTAAVSFGVAVGEIAAGTSGLEAIPAALLGALGGMAVQMGELAIATGIAALGIKAALTTLNPALAIAGGIALVALGTAVSGAASNIGKGTGGGSSLASSPRSNFTSSASATTQQQQPIKIELVLAEKGGGLASVLRIDDYRRLRTR